MRPRGKPKGSYHHGVREVAALKPGLPTTRAESQLPRPGQVQGQYLFRPASDMIQIPLAHLFDDAFGDMIPNRLNWNAGHDRVKETLHHHFNRRVERNTPCLEVEDLLGIDFSDG